MDALGGQAGVLPSPVNGLNFPLIPFIVAIVQDMACNAGVLA